MQSAVKLLVALRYKLTSPTKQFLIIIALISGMSVTSGNGVQAATSIDNHSPYMVKVGAPKSMQKYVRVAFNGFFDPAATSGNYSHNSYKVKKYKNSPPKAKYKQPDYSKQPTYSLGAKKYKGYIKSYNYNSGLDFEDDYYDPEIETYRRKPRTTYRTMCVRLKDGFYWPINFARNKSQFRKDRIKCQQSCSSKVRLFYYPSTSDKVEQMTDVKGRKYTSLKSAFLYRKKYVKGADCKPKPWSNAAKSLHKKYAAIDTEKKRRVHIALTKRAEKKRVAALKRQARKIARKLARKGKARRGRKVARAYRRKKYTRRYKAKKYSYNY